VSIGNSPDGNSPEDARPFEGDRDDASASKRPSIGQALREARIAAGLTIDNVSTATRVRVPIVQAIEQGDFAPCGGDVYARGHIRTLAQAVHLDPAPLLEQYAAEHGARPALTPATPLFEAERIRPERRGPNWTAAMVAAIVVVIAFVGFTLVKGTGSSDSADTQVAKGPTTSTSKAASPTPKSSKPTAQKPEPSDSAIAAAPRDKVTVQVSAVGGRSWISAKDHNGRTLFDGLLNKGDSQTFQDKEKIDLVVGDAGAIQLYVNGKKIQDDFQTGQVERLSYTKGDPVSG
jgi:cytoskeleton protein RodZ